MSRIDDIKQNDIEFVEESVSNDEERAREEKALVRKIDLYLLPTIWLMYLLSYMDVSLMTIWDVQHYADLDANRGPTLAMPKSRA